MDSQNQQSPQGTSNDEGNIANQQSAPQPPIELNDWLDPLLMNDDMLELPPNDGFGMIPMGGQQFVQSPMAQQAAENPIDQQFAQNPIHQQFVQSPMAQEVVQGPMAQHAGQNPVDQEFVQNPVDQQPAQNPMGQQVAQNLMDQQVVQDPMVQQFVQLPAETIVQMDRIMADVVGTDRHEAYWSILDDIYYFLRDHRWASIPDVRGNFRSRTSIEASYRPVGPPPAYIPPVWPLYEARTLAVGKEDIRQLVQDNIQFTLDAFRWAAFMDRFGTLEVTYANLGQTRPIVAGLHAKLALHEQQGVSWDNNKHGVVDQVLENMTYKNEPEFLAGEEWENRQKSHQVSTRYGFSQAAFADAPRLPEQERAQVLNLIVDGLNERNIVDKATHKTSRGERDNHVLVEKRNMSVFNMESTGWKALRALRKVSLGMPDVGVFNLDFVFKPYDTFGARLRDFRALFESSKAAVINTTETPFTTRYAGRPSSELTTKKWNKNGSARKATELAFASQARRNLVPAGQVGGAGQGDAVQGDAAQSKAAQNDPAQNNAQQDSSAGSHSASELGQADLGTIHDEDGQDAALTTAEESNVENTFVSAGVKRRRISDGDENERSN